MVPHPTRLDPIRYKYLRSGYRGRGLSLPPRVRWGLVALAVAVYVVNFVAGERGVVRKAQLRGELAEVRAEAAKLRIEKDRLEQEVLLKQEDPFSLEKVARERFMMVGVNEKMFRFEEDGEAPPEGPGDSGGLEAPGAAAGGVDGGVAGTPAGSATGIDDPGER